MKSAHFLLLLFGVVVVVVRASLNDVGDYNDDIYEANSVRDDTAFQVVADLPVQDARLVRDKSEEITNMTTKSPFKGGADQEWIEEAIKDIAYYLRAHKFNEYDRRYERNSTLAPHTYHYEHPRPPLRSLHWEVHKFCDESFLACIKYLWKRVQGAGLRRADDTSVVMQEQHWRPDTHAAQIAFVDAECQKMRQRDSVLADPFLGPLERFQWRTTAAYFMCWYTMNEVDHLRHITENCDNFANCLNKKLGARNRDYRANDDTPFACAQYSFCPDPCCYEKYMHLEVDCVNLPHSNPCYAQDNEGVRQCNVNRSQNIDFTSTILNHWNVTCVCQQAGFVWDSKYGICVDIDECLLGTHHCKKDAGEACLNLPGTYRCVCKWGYTWNDLEQNCARNVAVKQIKLTALKEQQCEVVEDVERSYIRRLFKYIRKKLKNDAWRKTYDYRITILWVAVIYMIF